MTHCKRTPAFCLILLLFVVLAVLSEDIHAQNARMTLPDGRQIHFRNPQGSPYLVTSRDGKVTSVSAEDPREIVRAIVMFKDRPLSIHHSRTRSLLKVSAEAQYASLQASHQSFTTLLNNAAKRMSAVAGFSYHYQLRYGYFRAINGVAIECNRGLLNQIRALPMVGAVCPDDSVRIDLSESVHQIGADRVQDSLGLTGKGVLVGEIDSGIDYLNPALGGGFGPGFRVIGGHDFANSDNDPRDDEGHGTHIAGIIGANDGGSLRGVAPDVKFLAVKVIGQDGSGSVSDIIAGIEYCMDPDGNPSTDDAVDVMNLSFGGLADVQAPMDSAVNAASAAGILSVVAAGNKGYYDAGTPVAYGTIGTPGTAESALTVGACDALDQVAAFSSKGPDIIHHAVKPDIVAPGVGILSLYLNNQTKTMSGTSMATPHVTGVAALLKQQHPDWSSEELKCAIVNSARSVGDTTSPYIQGNGRVDAFAAAELGLTAEPGILSFPLADLTASDYRDTLAFTIRNFRRTGQHVHLRAVVNAPPGFGITFSASDVALAPQGEMSIRAFLSASSSMPPFTALPYAYYGRIECVADSDRFTIPFGLAVTKSYILQVDCDVGPAWLFLWETGSTYFDVINTSPTTKTYSLEVRPRIYNLAALMSLDTVNMTRWYLVSKTNLNTNGLLHVTLNHSDATLRALAEPFRDMDNHEVNLDSASYFFGFQLVQKDPYNGPISTFDAGLWAKPSQCQVFTVPLDSAFEIFQRLCLTRGNDVFALDQHTIGIADQGGLALASGRDNLTGFPFTFAYSDTVPLRRTALVKYYVDRVLISPKTGRIDGESSTSQSVELGDLSACRFIFSKGNAPVDPLRMHYFTIGKQYGDVLGPEGGLTTANLMVNQNGEAVFFSEKTQFYDTTGIHTLDVRSAGDSIHVGQGADISLLVSGIQANGSTLSLMRRTIRGFLELNGGVMQPSGVYEWKNIFFYGPYYHQRDPRFTSQLFAGNVPVNPDAPTMNLFTHQSFTIPRGTDACRLIVDTQPYSLRGQAGSFRMDVAFTAPDVSLPPEQQGGTIPSLTLLQVQGNGRLTSWLRPGQEGRVRLIVSNPDTAADSVAVSLLTNAGIELPLTTVCTGGNEYAASIPVALASGFVDVIARVKNQAGNGYELTASPAFYYGNTMDNVQYDARLCLSGYRLNNATAAPLKSGDTLNYTLSYYNFGNVSARNIVVSFPSSQYFKPAGQATFTLDSLGAKDSCRVPLTLVFSGKKHQDDRRSGYAPAITWSSGPASYLRTHSVLIDFQSTLTGVAEGGTGIPGQFVLCQNYPNPFNPVTTVRFGVPRRMQVRLTVYNTLGQQITRLVDADVDAGYHEVKFDGSRFASGVYFYRLTAGSYVETKKLLLLR